MLTGGSCLDSETPRFAKQLARESEVVNVSLFVSTASDRLADADVDLITIHYNPCRYNRLRETYFEWLPTLGPIAKHLKTYELVFDDDAPEIPGSIVIHGTRERNLVWQKEALVNLALAQSTAKYFAWIDHDLVFTNPRWLDDAIDRLDRGAVAVQLFDRVIRLNLDRTIQAERPGSISQLASTGKPTGCPGGAWIADRAFMDSIGGLNIENLFGGGDQTFLDALLGSPGPHLREYSQQLAESLRQWIHAAYAHTGGRPIDHVPGKVYHLWHGEASGRQYATRYKVLKDSGFDPSLDIRLNADGLIEWCSHKPRLHQAIAKFFQRRREDG